MQGTTDGKFHAREFHDTVLPPQSITTPPAVFDCFHQLDCMDGDVILACMMVKEFGDPSQGTPPCPNLNCDGENSGFSLKISLVTLAISAAGFIGAAALG